MSDTPEFIMPAPEQVDVYLGRRVALTCRSEITFCGLARQVLLVGQRAGVLVETDPRTGLSVWCPVDQVKTLTVIPIPLETEAPERDHDGPRRVA